MTDQLLPPDHEPELPSEAEEAVTGNIAGDSAGAIAFLKRFHTNDLWCLTAIHPVTKKIETASFEPSDADAAFAWTEKRNGTWNLYFSVNPLRQKMSKKAKASDVARLCYLHVDVDPRILEGDMTLEDEQARILALFNQNLPVGVTEPTVVVFSGGGYQAFWKLAEPVQLDGTEEAAEAVKLYNKKLELDFGGDHCHNIDRIMRLPGSVNVPDEKKRKKGRKPALAKVVQANWNNVYQLEQFTPASETTAVAVLGDAASNNAVVIPAVWTRLGCLDDLQRHAAADRQIPERTFTIIEHGFHPQETNKPHEDRSRWVFDVTCALVRAGVPNEVIGSVLTDDRFKISAHVLDQKNVERCVKRQIEGALKRIALENDDFHCDGDHKPISKSQHNVKVALAKMGVTVKLDQFRNRRIAEGIKKDAVYLDDTYMNHLRMEIDVRFGFLVVKDFFYDVVYEIAHQNGFHPVRDFYDGLKWDGVPRLDTWLVTYGGAKETEYVRAVGKIALVAAVRRVRQPGCKYDEMLVLEGRQGTGKSTALKILAIREEWFADEVPLNGSGKEAIEALSGRLIVEAAELKGMSAGKVEHLKAFLSRQVDSARLAYGRETTEVPRQFVLVGTTNSNAYLVDATGNRRFWPVPIDGFDLEALKRDRDQLWAEAVELEAKGESIRLSPDLWAEAALEQELRQLEDPILNTLTERLGSLKGKILVEDVMRLLEIAPGQRHQGHNRRVGEAMAMLGWERKKLRHEGHNAYAYLNCSLEEAEWIRVTNDKENKPVAGHACRRWPENGSDDLPF